MIRANLLVLATALSVALPLMAETPVPPGDTAAPMSAEEFDEIGRAHV